MSNVEERSRWQKFTDFVKHRKPSTVRESDRFSSIGLLKYPQRGQMDYRLFALNETLENIDEEYAKVFQKRMNMIEAEMRKRGNGDEALTISQIDDLLAEELRDIQQKAIKKLSSTFHEAGAPWYRGLDNPRLSRKALAYHKILTCFGDMPAIYKVLNYGTNVLLDMSWSDKDVTPDTPVLMETKMQQVVQPGYGGTMPTSGGAISQTYEPKPKGGPYEKEMSSRVEE